MNRPARFTEADLRRAVKVAAQQGPGCIVEVQPDGTIRIAWRPVETAPPRPAPADMPVEDDEEIVL